MKWLLISLLLCCSMAFAGEWEQLHEKLTKSKPVNYGKSSVFWDHTYGTHGITEIGLERTACLGTCPAYTLMIKADGTFRYRGEYNAPKMGIYTGKVQVGNLMGLCGFIKDSGYMNLEHTYIEAATDQPTAYTTVVMNGKRKIIRNYGNSGPAKLWAIEQLIDKLILEAQWNPRKLSK